MQAVMCDTGPMSHSVESGQKCGGLTAKGLRDIFESKRKFNESPIREAMSDWAYRLASG